MVVPRATELNADLASLGWWGSSQESLEWGAQHLGRELASGLPKRLILRLTGGRQCLFGPHCIHQLAIGPYLLALSHATGAMSLF